MEQLKSQAFDLLVEKERLVFNYEFSVSNLRQKFEQDLQELQIKLNNILEKINDNNVEIKQEEL